MPVGGKRPGAGRPKGAVNKSTIEIKSLAQKHGKAAIDCLVELVGHKEPDIRLRASQAILDRGYGKPAQAIAGPDGEGPALVGVIERIVVAKNA